MISFQHLEFSEFFPIKYISLQISIIINKNIYKNIMSTQAAIGIIRSTYKNEEKEIVLDNSIGFLIEISMGVIFPYWEEMSIQFLTGYNFNGIKNQDDEDLLNSPFVGIGMQILGDWF